ncbi:glycosyltransferase family 2 protein [Kutzneria kofuensis]|uniref:Glycosyltransferase involved in cell wall biosynthesis n=1 Tax=Kutzneria kofuensis TaxID=103725 RepID=A0A7W9KH29_9PSEU|nr:glycosyltransferase family 2 protein [Kutzneria kofuensis]MBB5892472.1 glycosyltransferase involved in cell wall biosynthesis [Kutzneria kofuensis]
MGTIDILMPYYGDVGLMQDAVRSVLAQDDPDWRLTVVDDGKAEGVPEWFAGLGDDRVRYFRNERNLGVTGNFNRCVELAEHDRMVLFGSDDLLLPNYVRTIRALEQRYPDAGMIQPGVEVIDGDGNPVRTLADETKRRLYAPKITGSRLMAGEELAVSLLRGNWLYFPSVAWKAKAVKEIGFRDDLSIIQDLALVLDLMERGESLVVDDTLSFRYRRHNASASGWTAIEGSRFVEARNFFVEAAERMERRGWPRAAKAARAHLSSRLHALTVLPAVLKQRNAAGVKTLVRHAFGPSRHIDT